MERSFPAEATDPANWVDDYGDYLYRYAVARVRDAGAAEELVQETFLGALSARHAFRGEASERSWLTAILKRKVVDWLRAQVRRRATQAALPEGGLDEVFKRSGRWRIVFDEWRPDQPGREIIREEFWAVLTGCLDKLPARLRQAFVLRHLDGQATAEVGRSLGASAENLWVMLHRARMRLWRCLEETWFREDPAGATEPNPP
jgi:RNA polymerase sigma-70 factor (ECF subfamily)